MLVAPRIENDVSYVADINHESHFTWQAQHLSIVFFSMTNLMYSRELLIQLRRLLT